MSGDRIEIRGLRVSARVGVLEFEREQDQPLEIDLDLMVDLGPAGRTDELDDTVDYGAVCALVDRVVTSESPLLLERLAELIAATILDATTCDEVSVSVRKLRPPVPQQLATSGVRITRVRRQR